MELMLMVFFISLLTVVTGTVYRKMEDFYLTEPLLAMFLGLILGPAVLDLLKAGGNPETEFKVLKTTCEFTMAMALMATALRLPPKFAKKNAGMLSRLVIFGMLLMWFSSSAIFYWVLEGFSLAECLLLGAIITPTDPVVASSIVAGDKARKYLPSSVRGSLSFEAGANDGLAFPLLMLSVFLLTSSQFPMEEFLVKILAYETLLCSFLSFFTGILAGKLMHTAHKKGYMNEKALLPFSLALALLLISGMEILNMNGILGVFAGGLGFAHVISRNEDLKEKKVQESMERIFTIPVFFIFGMMLPWEDWFSLGWTAVGLIFLILLLRRIPVFLILMPFLSRFRGKFKDVLIIGWFGPIGVAALYYVIHARENTNFEGSWLIVSLIVFASTVVHGITSVPLEKKYYKLKKKQQNH